MLTSITIRNFKSFHEATLPLAPLTLLIGANASGKSNAIEAIRFLSWLARGQRLGSIQYDIQSSDLIVRGNTHDLLSHGALSFGFDCTFIGGLEIGDLEILSISIAFKPILRA